MKHSTKSVDLSDIKESFCYLFVGHWMNGNFGHDRKNVGVLVKEFYDTFKDIKGSKPALILKASVGTSSYISREEILNKIAKIRRSINSKNLPTLVATIVMLVIVATVPNLRIGKVKGITISKMPKEEGKEINQPLPAWPRLFF